MLHLTGLAVGPFPAAPVLVTLAIMSVMLEDGARRSSLQEHAGGAVCAPRLGLGRVPQCNLSQINPVLRSVALRSGASSQIYHEYPAIMKQDSGYTPRYIWRKLTLFLTLARRTPILQVAVDSPGIGKVQGHTCRCTVATRCGSFRS